MLIEATNATHPATNKTLANTWCQYKASKNIKFNVHAIQ